MEDFVPSDRPVKITEYSDTKTDLTASSKYYEKNVFGDYTKAEISKVYAKMFARLINWLKDGHDFKFKI